MCKVNIPGHMHRGLHYNLLKLSSTMVLQDHKKFVPKDNKKVKV